MGAHYRPLPSEDNTEGQAAPLDSQDEPIRRRWRESLYYRLSTQCENFIHTSSHFLFVHHTNVLTFLKICGCLVGLGSFTRRPFNFSKWTNTDPLSPGSMAIESFVGIWVGVFASYLFDVASMYYLYKNDMYGIDKARLKDSEIKRQNIAILDFKNLEEKDRTLTLTLKAKIKAAGINIEDETDEAYKKIIHEIINTNKTIHDDEYIKTIREKYCDTKESHFKKNAGKAEKRYKRNYEIFKLKRDIKYAIKFAKETNKSQELLNRYILDIAKKSGIFEIDTTNPNELLFILKKIPEDDEDTFLSNMSEDIYIEQVNTFFFPDKTTKSFTESLRTIYNYVTSPESFDDINSRLQQHLPDTSHDITYKIFNSLFGRDGTKVSETEFIYNMYKNIGLFDPIETFERENAMGHSTLMGYRISKNIFVLPLRAISFGMSMGLGFGGPIYAIIAVTFFMGSLFLLLDILGSRFKTELDTANGLNKGKLTATELPLRLLSDSIKSPAPTPNPSYQHDSDSPLSYPATSTPPVDTNTVPTILDDSSPLHPPTVLGALTLGVS